MAQCEYIYLKKQQITFQKRKTQSHMFGKQAILGSTSFKTVYILILTLSTRRCLSPHNYALKDRTTSTFS